MSRVVRVLWWAGPWLGLAFFVWRQQTLEANLASWVKATNEVFEAGVQRFADASAEHVGESKQGRVRDDDRDT